MVLDFTLIWLKHLVAHRLKRRLRVPSILLMSATLDQKKFVNHFKNVNSSGNSVPTPSLSVPGRAYRVCEKYLEEVLSDIQGAHNSRALELLSSTIKCTSSLRYVANELNLSAGHFQSARTAATSGQEVFWDTSHEVTTPVGLIAATIAHVASTSDTGTILVFLPGIGEINNVEETLKSAALPIFGVDFRLGRKFKLLKLHSNLPGSQQEVFQPVGDGVRKIILSSPVAETSVTIPDVTFVIDSGQVRELQYDQSSRVSWLRNG